MGDILRNLNAAQVAAVSSPATVLQVLAPPGSGKTKTLTARVAHLISNHGLQPHNIIVCTFTVKAARDMKERIEGFLGPRVANKLILGTFHSIARRFLASYGNEINLDPKFGIADASDSKNIISRIIKAAKLTINPKQARSRISTLKSESISATQHANSYDKQSKSIEIQELTTVYTEYEAHLRLTNLLDYDDLLLRCADLLRRAPSCVSNIESVLIDEFQDTNHVQYDLMRLFSQHKSVITIVGDPDQSIYGWRSAKIENLEKMQKQYPGTHVVNLEENYRSSGAILLAAQEIIEQDTARPQKSLMPTHSLGLSPVLRKLPSAPIEAEWLVLEIQRSVGMTGGLLKWCDFAILLRSAALSRLIEAALAKAGIPYRMVGGLRFFDRAEVKLVLDYLRVIDHVEHSDAVARILNVPSRKIGDATLQSLLEEADERKITLWILVKNVAQGRMKTKKDLSKQTLKGLELFVNFVLTTKKKLIESSNQPLSHFIQYVIGKIGLKKYLEDKYPEQWESRWANVEELVSHALEVSDQSAQESLEHALRGEDDEAANSEQSREEILSDFLGNIALSTETTEKGKETENGHVVLSTMHAAKGLEWPVVFVPAAYEGSIPHSRAEDFDEERRLLYVAMTRAQSMLYLSCPTRDSMGGTTTLSSFLSTRKMAGYFTYNGPRFDFDVVNELSLILRRPCPRSVDIDRAKLIIRRIEDTEWPQNAKDGEEERSSEEHWTSNEPARSRYSEPMKRARESVNISRNKCEDYHSGKCVSIASIETTMQKPYAFSSSSTTVSIGFTSASNLPRIEMQTDGRTDRTIMASTMTDERPAKRCKVESKSKSRNQTHLTNFFSKSQSDSVPLSSEAMTLENNLGSPLNDITNHILAEEVLGQERSWPSDESKPAITTHGNAISREPPSFRPASTMHLTSISQAQNPPPIRRSLGVRRSMNGWASRRERDTTIHGR